MSDILSQKSAIYHKAYFHWGELNRWDKTIEEMGELQQAIIKQRYHPSQENQHHLIEELADVTILVEQMRAIIIENGMGAVLAEYDEKKLAKLAGKLP